MKMVLTGLEELEKSLDKVEKGFQKALRVATVAGARVIQKEAKDRCPVGTEVKKGFYAHKPGNLRRSIKLRALKPKDRFRQAVIVGPAVGKREKFDGFYGRWVEEGHRIAKPGQRLPKIKRHPISEKYVGKRWKNQYSNGIIGEATAVEYGDSMTEPKPFLRPAFDEKQETAMAKMAEVFRDVAEGKVAEQDAFGDLVDMIEDIVFEGL